MAKAKKSEVPATEAKESVAKTAVKKPAAKVPKAKAAAEPAAAPTAPMVDTNLAAQAAARMVGAKASGLSPMSSGADKKETSAFKQMKQSFTKPHSASVGNMLNSTISSAAKKNNTPFQHGKQVGHNQTFGSDASKNFVPRRTGG